jgi:hypothetical protein
VPERLIYTELGQHIGMMMRTTTSTTGEKDYLRILREVGIITRNFLKEFGKKMMGSY